MGCFRPSRPKQQEPKTLNSKQEILFRIPGCTVHLMEQGAALELAKGEFMIVQVTEENASLATIIKVGNELQWPLTKDEPVLKLNSLHYLFSLPIKGSDPLSYGVTFSEQYVSSMASLDSFFTANSCFTIGSGSSGTKDVDWIDFAPRIGDYNNFLAKAIAGGSGNIVKGIFKLSNTYSNQVHSGGETILSENGIKDRGTKSIKRNGATNKSGVNQTLKRVKNLSKMTENLSKTALEGVGVVTGSVMAPVMKSQAGKTVLSIAPVQVLLASLDAVNKILDAAEAAERQALTATSKAATKMVSNRFGENAGEATEDVFATAGHCANTAWNIFKIRKALNPASSLSSGVLKNAGKYRNTQ